MAIKKQRTKKRLENMGMVDISAKDITRRVAIATAAIRFTVRAFAQLLNDGSPKGDIFETAKVAGIMAAKSTPQIVPMCHPLDLTKVQVLFVVDKRNKKIQVIAEVHCLGRTGVEMEALCAASVAALTIYDMMKWADKSMSITDVKLLEKRGGKSGDFKRRD